MYGTKICQATLVISVLLGFFHGVSAIETLSERRTQEGDNAALAPEDQGISGGFDVETAIPWLVYIDEFARCTGALVHSDIVITSASCLLVGVPKTVRVGSLSTNSGGVVVGVSGAVIHPDFDSTSASSGADIAVLKLDNALTNTVALMNEESLVPKSSSDLLFTMGLGATSDTTLATTLQGMYTYYLEDCFAVDNLYNPIYHVCTETFLTTLCDGDFGAPLVMAETRNIVGIAIGSSGACSSDDDDIFKTNFFTRMSSYTDWVKDTACEISANEPTYCDSDHKDGCFFDSIFSALNSVFSFGDF